ncbi:MAG: hypothetical protein ACR2H0_01280 [Candidatus Limnocylindrales bacterium]
MPVAPDGPVVGVHAPDSTVDPKGEAANLGPTAVDEVVQFTVSLNLRDEEGLADFLEGVSERGRPTSGNSFRQPNSACVLDSAAQR